jgi:hypothetical protein
MIINAIPIWALFIGTILVVLAAIEGGYLLGQFAHRRSEEEKESPVSAMAGTVLGLVAFILAFTFGSVYDRFDARKELTREEVNVIRTAWLRSEFWPEPNRTEAKGLIREYTEKRLAFVQARDLSPERVKSMNFESQRILSRLWEMAVADALRDMNSDVAALYLESLNEMIAIHASRVAVGIQARIPAALWFVLYCITILGMMGVGYQTGIAGSKRSMARPILAVSFALVILLIASLDNPIHGIIDVSQQPFIDLLSSMGTH